MMRGLVALLVFFVAARIFEIGATRYCVKSQHAFAFWPGRMCRKCYRASRWIEQRRRWSMFS